MNNISPDEVLKIEKVLSEALLHHGQWYDDLLRSLICHLPFPDSITARDAHYHCAFGSWFYGMGKTQVQKLPAFKKIAELHRAMHDSAREMCLKFRTMGKVSKVEYDVFKYNLDHFREEINILIERVSELYQEAKAAQEAEAAQKAKQEEANATNKAEAEQKTKAHSKTDAQQETESKDSSKNSNAEQKPEPKKTS